MLTPDLPPAPLQPRALPAPANGWPLPNPGGQHPVVGSSWPSAQFSAHTLNHSSPPVLQSRSWSSWNLTSDLTLCIWLCSCPVYLTFDTAHLVLDFSPLTEDTLHLCPTPYALEDKEYTSDTWESRHLASRPVNPGFAVSQITMVSS